MKPGQQQCSVIGVRTFGKTIRWRLVGARRWSFTLHQNKRRERSVTTKSFQMLLLFIARDRFLLWLADRLANHDIPHICTIPSFSQVSTFLGLLSCLCSNLDVYPAGMLKRWYREGMLISWNAKQCRKKIYRKSRKQLINNSGLFLPFSLFFSNHLLVLIRFYVIFAD